MKEDMLSFAIALLSVPIFVTIGRRSLRKMSSPMAIAAQLAQPRFARRNLTRHCSHSVHWKTSSPMAIVAQLVRASGCGPEGRGFKSHRSPQNFLKDRRGQTFDFSFGELD